MRDYLATIVERKWVEVGRRKAHRGLLPPAPPVDPDRGARAVERLRRRSGDAPRVIAEVKFRSPSAGAIRERTPGESVRVARAYASAGAAAVSVLADGPGFGGSVLDVRRVAGAIEAPVLFKGFVLDPLQVEMARRAGAALVLLLVRVLEDDALRALVDEVRAQGMEPVVEAADAEELERALATGATIVGVNARDLRTFRVDPVEAGRILAAVPEDRVAVFMSGVRDRESFARVAAGRADACLIGEGLMRAPSPGVRLREITGREP